MKKNEKKFEKNPIAIYYIYKCIYNIAWVGSLDFACACDKPGNRSDVCKWAGWVRFCLL